MIFDRVLQIIEYYGDSHRSIAKKLTVSPAYFSKPKEIGSEKLAIILNIYPKINPDWLLLGHGSMFKDSETQTTALNSIHPEPKEQWIPLLPIDATAGFGSGDFSIEENDIQDRYLVPDFDNINFMIRVTGDSMSPKYNSGDVVACRIINKGTFIQPNKTHLIDTVDQGLMVKRIKKGENGTLVAISDNPDYDPFEIPEEQVRGLALIVGLIRLE